MTREPAVPLDQLLADVRACRVCVTHPRGPPLPHEPRPVLVASPSARLAICGQAPGLRVHECGVPFSDASGDRLRAWMGVRPEQFYDARQVAILPMGFCFPGYDKTGSDLPPRRECATQWRARVMAGLPHLELMLVVGRYAMAWHLANDAAGSVTDTVAAWAAILARDRAGPAMLPLPHPSWRNTGWLKANPWFDDELVPVLQARVRAVLR